MKNSVEIKKRNQHIHSCFQPVVITAEVTKFFDAVNYSLNTAFSERMFWVSKLFINSTENYSGITYRVFLDIYIWIHISSELNICFNFDNRYTYLLTYLLTYSMEQSSS